MPEYRLLRSLFPWRIIRLATRALENWPQGHLLIYTRRRTTIQTKLDLPEVVLHTHPRSRDLLRVGFDVSRALSKGTKAGVTLKSSCGWNFIIVAPAQRLQHFLSAAGPVQFFNAYNFTKL